MVDVRIIPSLSESVLNLSVVIFSVIAPDCFLMLKGFMKTKTPMYLCIVQFICRMTPLLSLAPILCNDQTMLTVERRK